MNPEASIRAVIVERFDLGFILRHPKGRFGQLRVPEMSAMTAALDRSPEPKAGLGVELDVYIVKEFDGRYLFSEFSSADRTERERQAQLAIEARSRAQPGQHLTVTVHRKFDWGWICRETNGSLEGLVLNEVMLKENGWHNPEMLLAWHVFEQLQVGSCIEVVIARNECSSGGKNVLYFGSADA